MGRGRKTYNLDRCQLKLYVIQRGGGMARDRSGDADREKESRSDLGKHSGFCGQ